MYSKDQNIDEAKCAQARHVGVLNAAYNGFVKELLILPSNLDLLHF